MKGLRYLLRNYIALAVNGHLRSPLEQKASEAELTPNEVELVRFTAERSDQLQELAVSSPSRRQH